MRMCDNRNSEKEIVRVTSENASKRHLPPWMLPKVAAATIPVRNSVSAEKNCTSEKETIAEAPDLTGNAEIALKKAGAGRKRETLRRKSYSHAECEVKRRRKLSKQDAGSDGSAKQKDKKKKDSSKVRSLNSSNKSQIVEDLNCGDIDANSVRGFNDDDIEITVEDLMTIAEEYVKEYEKKKQKEASNSQCGSVKQFPMTGEYGNSLDYRCERKRSSTPGGEGLYSSTSNKTGELVPTRTSRAGDPAQEMLELLLGPLLKHLEEEKNKSIVETVEFTQESPGKSQKEFSGEDKVPLMKRKCSLKDKVGLFLD